MNVIGELQGLRQSLMAIRSLYHFLPSAKAPDREQTAAIEFKSAIVALIHPLELQLKASEESRDLTRWQALERQARQLYRAFSRWFAQLEATALDAPQLPQELKHYSLLYHESLALFSLIKQRGASPRIEAREALLLDETIQTLPLRYFRAYQRQFFFSGIDSVYLWGKLWPSTI